ncbi:M23 family metallopeptidase [Nostocaceae cyanobacterium CENA357]|uniref:M23 family metallopeptidase n=1 Tax=Atlanticothrix silvestris CENA357 TaxID=1725252 RepID=A0A8J7HGQ9_9CYAN|nr:M23 family metallopeptidase [Atlanticothrix silvestris]MBH8552735.1 M23 family metallopeptidase [Atlanticothrix silvestris CENA357]
MKKLTIGRFCRYTYIGLISSIAVFSTTTSAFTQVVDNSPIRQTPIPASNLIWPTQGFISQGFRKYQHEGIDIAGASGTPIVAAASGTVVKAGWDNWGLGNSLEIKHPDGSLTVYGHNRRLLVSKNQQVSQGQIIAEMGSTGNSTAPHLHFEFHPDGRLAADPLRKLSSSTASKIPPQPVTISASRGRPVSKPPIVQQVSPPQPIPTNVAPITNTKCSGITVIEGETASIRVKVCDDHGHLFYVGQLKQDPSQPVKIPAWNIGKDTYQADNGSFSYLVNREKVEVWRNGSQIRSDNFHTLTR